MHHNVFSKKLRYEVSGFLDVLEGFKANRSCQGNPRFPAFC